MARSAPRGPSIPASPRAADRYGRGPCRYPFAGGFCFLVASPPVQDLLLSAKHLFVGARPFEVLVALMGWAEGCQPWGRSASSAVAAAPVNALPSTSRRGSTRRLCPCQPIRSATSGRAPP